MFDNDLCSHFHSLHFDTPGRGGLVEDHLHGTGNALSVAEDLVEALGTEDISQSGLSQKSGGVVGVLDVGHGHRGVGDPVVDDRVDGDCHGVFCQDLEARTSYDLYHWLIGYQTS